VKGESSLQTTGLQNKSLSKSLLQESKNPQQSLCWAFQVPVCNFVCVLSIGQEQRIAQFFKEQSIFRSILFFQASDYLFLDIKEAVNSSVSGLKTYEIHGAKSLNSPLILCLQSLLQLFPPQQHSRPSEHTWVFPLREGTYTRLQGTRRSATDVREAAFPGMGPAVQLQFTARCNLPPTLQSHVLTIHNVEESKLGVSISRLLAADFHVIFIIRVLALQPCISKERSAVQKSKGRCADVGYFHDVILEYEMLTRALHRALWGVEISQSRASGRKPVTPLSANMCDIYVFMSLYGNVLPVISLQFGKLFIP